MNAHTPGPWKVHSYRNIEPHCITIDVGPGLRAVAKIFGEFERSHAGEEAEANARLIAAAPEMLEALQAAYVELRKHIGGEVTLQVSEAIAKATGET